jgi:NTP pyrophosphatase (non-canonical NTP hydrolase)
MSQKLIDNIRKTDFEPAAYDGFMFSDFQFMRFFPLNHDSLNQCFDKVNSFLNQNGYSEFKFDVFMNELSASNEKVTVYADPYASKEDSRLILVIEKYSPNTNPIDEIILQLIRFRNERDWEQFHNPKDLALALNVEAAELLELFLWKDANEANQEKIKEELADVFAFAFLLAEKYNFDVNEIVLEKIKRNAEKYPVEKSKGSSRKYNEL